MLDGLLHELWEGVKFLGPIVFVGIVIYVYASSGRNKQKAQEHTAEAHGTAWPGSHGVAIYYPESSANFNINYNGTTILFAQDTHWEEFLSDFYTFMSGSWVADARDQSQEYSTCGGWCPHHIDLYDFCEKLIANASGLVWVDFYHSGTELGTYQYPYNTLAEGVAAASAGQTVCIKPGTSSETMDISKQLNLRACGGMAIIGQ